MFYDSKKYNRSLPTIHNQKYNIFYSSYESELNMPDMLEKTMPWISNYMYSSDYLCQAVMSWKILPKSYLNKTKTSSWRAVDVNIYQQRRQLV